MTTTARARLHPDESQRVFRVLVDALASPGRVAGGHQRRLPGRRRHMVAQR
ncbi:MAG: hypothetical protein ABW122_00600 [Ilumatobacteraceae bacterium]